MKYNLPEIDQNKIYILKKEAKKQIEKDDELQTFIALNHIPEEVIDKSLSKFIKVLDDRKECKNCPGISKCTKKMGHYQISLQYNDVYEQVENTVVACKYEKKRLEIKKDFIVADFNETFLDYSLKETLVHFANERSKLVLDMAQSIRNLKQNMNEKGYFVTGDPEVGKTFIEVVYASALVKEKLGKVAFINSISYFDGLIKSFNNEKEYFNQIFEKLKNVDFLFIDDFGNEFKSGYVFDNILFPLLSYRFQRQLPTSFTSQYTIEEIKRMYTFNKAMELKVNKLFSKFESETKVFVLRGMRFPR